MAALILEGGTFRPIFSAGAMDALLDYGVEFPYCIGVSAGITNGFSYISKQKGRNLKILEKYRNDSRYFGVRNLLKYQSLFGVSFVFEEIPNTLLPFDVETFLRYQGQYLVGVTNAQTGETEYLDGKKIDEKNTMVKATCALPLYFPPVSWEGALYYDGGIGDPIPVQKALDDGHEKMLIILTRPVGYIKTCGRSNQLAARLLAKKYPKMAPKLLSRHEYYNKSVKLCERLEREGRAVILRPSGVGIIDSFEKDYTKIKRSYDYGYELAAARIDEIRHLL